MQNFTNLWLAYELTGSTFYLGLVGGVLATSTILFSLFGGILADRFDRRWLLAFTQVSMGLIMLTVATLVALKIITIWHILVIAPISGMVQAFERPARESLLPHLIEDKKHLPSAIALSSVVWQMTRIVGPALAGIIIGFGGAAVSFYIAGALYFILVVAILPIRLTAQLRAAEKGNMWKSLAEGLSHIYKSSFFKVIIGMTFINSIFGTSYIFLMPAFTRDILKVGPEGYGFIMTACGVGGLIGTMAAAFFGRSAKKYLLFILSSIATGVFIIIFAHSKLYMLSLIAAGTAALVTNIYMVMGQVFLQTLVPDNLRGRVMSVYGLVWSLMPLGSLQAGTVATYVGAPVAVTIGASILIGFSVFLLVFARDLKRLNP